MAYATRDKYLHRWSIQLLRAEYRSQPPKLQAETRERVARMLEAERARRQSVPSYLMRHYEEIYQP
jgi:hypothetical protein